MRFLFYSHDSFGLGHLRRSITLAGHVRAICPQASILIATGSSQATRFKMPVGVDVLKLPAATKDQYGAYVPRDLDLGLDELIRLRSSLLATATRAFRPDVLLVDHKPIGLLGELEPAFEQAQRIGTRCVLGIRDIVDHPDAVADEWATEPVQRALGEVYATVLIYGDRRVFDAAEEYPELSRVAERARFTGYVVRPPAVPGLRPLAALKPEVVVTVGGGQDGARRIDRYLDSIDGEAPPWNSTIVLGPLLEAEGRRRIQRRAAGIAGTRVHRFHEDLPARFRDASAVVSMAGYNSCAELLQARVPTVLLPRVSPRREQLVRSERLSALGLASHAVDPGPAELRALVGAAIRSGRVQRPGPSLNGGTVAARFLAAAANQRSLPDTDGPCTSERLQGLAS